MDKIDNLLNYLNTNYYKKFQYLNPLENIDNAEKKILNLYKKAYFSKNILIIGDFDVDGITSTTIMKDLLSNFKHSDKRNIGFYIPSRYDGYSVNPNVLNALFQTKKIDMIIMLDNGTDKNIIQAIKENNLKDKVFIIDHHPNSDIEDENFLINPQIDNEISTSTGLLLNEIYRRTHNYLVKNGIIKDYMRRDRYLNLATLSGLADIVTKNNLYNRNIIKEGLKNIAQSDELLFKLNILEDSVLQDLNFKIIPLINSLGRLGTGKDLNNFDYETLFFETDDRKTFYRAFNKLKNLNNFRKKATNFFYNLAKEKYNGENVFVFYHDNMPIGINGIIAQKFHQNGIKTLCLSPNPVNPLEIVGSGRGYGFKNIMMKFVKEHSLPVHIGGHNVAFGVKMPVEVLNDFLEKFNKYNFNIPDEKINIYNKDIFDLDEFFILADKFKKRFVLPFDEMPSILIHYNNINLIKINDYKDYCVLKYKNNKFLVSSEEANYLLNNEKALVKLPYDKNNFNLTTLSKNKIDKAEELIVNYKYNLNKIKR
jgi:single-stranded-DNA-specific exonuclease